MDFPCHIFIFQPFSQLHTKSMALYRMKRAMLLHRVRESKRQHSMLLLTLNITGSTHQQEFPSQYPASFPVAICTRKQSSDVPVQCNLPCGALRGCDTCRTGRGWNAVQQRLWQLCHRRRQRRFSDRVSSVWVHRQALLS